ncbi:hypothetical protein chiPu_0030522, partial [Chiloscyllium punctatum]|nr:hypothetical protein [Chiloscyllium punctatum]
VIGLALLLTLVSIAVGISCCHVSRCCGRPYYWWEYQQMYLEEVERLLLTNLRDSAGRRAESNFGSETAMGSAEAAWEHISSVGFAKIEYPDDFRAALRADGESPPGEREAAKDGAGGGEAGPGEQGAAEPAAPTDGVSGPAGQTAAPGPEEEEEVEEEAGKPGWRIRLRGHLLEIKKSLRRTLGRSALK